MTITINSLHLDFWYPDQYPLAQKKYKADYTLYHNPYIYRGNIYDTLTGKIIGDFETTEFSDIDEYFI